MKKFSKILLGAAAVFGVVGCGLTVGGAVMGAGMQDIQIKNGSVKSVVDHMIRLADDWEDDDFQEEKKAELNQTTGRYEFDQVSSMDIELSCDELILQETEEAKFSVEVTGENTEQVLVSSEGSELQIESSGETDNRTVTVFYPKGTEFMEVSLDIGAGTASLESPLTAQEFTASVRAGIIESDARITVNEADMEVGVGSLELAVLDSKYIEAECGVGEISLQVPGVKEDYSYSISCGAGTILLDNEEFSGIASAKDIRNDGSTGSMDLVCGMGTIKVEFVK